MQKNFVSLLFILAFAIQCNAQGEFLEKGESAHSLLFSTTNVEGKVVTGFLSSTLRSERYWAAGYTFTHKRILEAGLSIAQDGILNPDDRIFAFHAGLYVNTNSIFNFKLFLISQGANSGSLHSPGITVFLNKAEKYDRILPAVSILYVDSKITYDIGLQFRISRRPGIIVGANFFINQFDNTSFSFNLGYLFI